MAWSSDEDDLDLALAGSVGKSTLKSGNHIRPQEKVFCGKSRKSISADSYFERWISIGENESEKNEANRPSDSDSDFEFLSGNREKQGQRLDLNMKKGSQETKTEDINENFCKEGWGFDLDEDDYPRIPTNRRTYSEEFDKDIQLRPYLYDRGSENEKYKDFPKLILSASYGKWLLEHQHKGVIWVYNRICKGRGVILADDMGLGKTIQIVSLLTVLYRKTGKESVDYENLRDRKRWQRNNNNNVAPEMKTTLILVPASICVQWKRELETWGVFAASLFPQDASQRESVIYECKNRILEILIVSYDTFRSQETLWSIDWELVILDEIHNLKNPRSASHESVAKLKTLRRIGLTGTLMQNNYSELFYIMDLVHPGDFGTHADFKQYYSRPIERGRQKKSSAHIQEEGKKKSKELRQKMKTWIMQRDKSLIRDRLPKKIVRDVFCKMSNLQIKIYKRILQSPEGIALMRKDEPCPCGRRDMKRGDCCFKVCGTGFLWNHLHQDGVECVRCPNCLGFPLMTLLKKVANHLELLKLERISKKKETASFEEQFVRSVIGPYEEEMRGIQRIRNELDLGDSTHCGKLEVFKQLLQQWRIKQRKILVFSNSTAMLNILEACFKRVSYSYVRLDGNMTKKAKSEAVEYFTNSGKNTFAFLISTKAGGTGLNLTAADIVVNFDPSWNPAHDLQSQDRAYRIGQDRDVYVYRSGSIEQQMYIRQMYKIQLSNVTLAGISEKRYFNGIQGCAGEKGEMFGLKNLLSYNEEGLPKELQCLSTGTESGNPKTNDGKSIKFDVIQNQVDDNLLQEMVKAEENELHPIFERKLRTFSKKTAVAKSEEKSDDTKTESRDEEFTNGAELETQMLSKRKDVHFKSQRTQKLKSVNVKTGSASKKIQRETQCRHPVTKRKIGKGKTNMQVKKLQEDPFSFSKNMEIESGSEEETGRSNEPGSITAPEMTESNRILKEKAEITLNNSDVVGAFALGCSQIDYSQALDGKAESDEDDNFLLKRPETKGERKHKPKRKRKKRLKI